MKNYKRFISYLYFYEAGRKVGNVGFARVETSDELGKLTIHCTTKTFLKNECKVYLLKRSKASITSKKIGSVVAHNGFLDLKLVYAQGKIEGADFNLRETQGVVLMYSRDNYIAAKWDNSNFSYHEALIIEQNEEMAEAVQKETEVMSGIDMFENEDKGETVKAAFLGLAEARIDEQDRKIYMVDSSNVINISKLSERKDGTEKSTKEIPNVNNVIEISKTKEMTKEENDVSESRNDKVLDVAKKETNHLEQEGNKKENVEVVREGNKEIINVEVKNEEEIRKQGKVSNRKGKEDKAKEEDQLVEHKGLTNSINITQDTNVNNMSEEIEQKLAEEMNQVNEEVKQSTAVDQENKEVKQVTAVDQENKEAKQVTAVDQENKEAKQVTIIDVDQENDKAEQAPIEVNQEKQVAKSESVKDVTQENEEELFKLGNDDNNAEEEGLQAENYVKPNPNLWADHPQARAILNRFVRMYPFDDGEIAECVRLEPKDIGLLPMSAWVLGNNSFLLHSYCNFRHLLFAKMLTREGCVYLLMVPGAHNNREQQLAKMFGFEHFKCSRRRSIRDGEFGYWYVTISFE